MTPQILFALQSPTLLNNLAQIRDVWDLRWVQVENVDFQEKELIDIPEWDGEVPVAFVGCAPDHERWAHDNLRGLPYISMIHHSDPANMNGDQSWKMCAGMQLNGIRILEANYRVKWSHFLSPAYDVNPVWSWAHSSPWGMMSRPTTRGRRIQSRLAYITRSLPGIKMYGQGQPMGFVSGKAKDAVIASSSCLVGMVDESSGFGLMEHEAMAAGVPVVSKLWGDMAEEAPGHPGLASSDEELVRLARRCCSDRGFAEEVSAAGLDYIRRCRTLDRLRDSAEGLLRKIASTS